MNNKDNEDEEDKIAKHVMGLFLGHDGKQKARRNPARLQNTSPIKKQSFKSRDAPPSVEDSGSESPPDSKNSTIGTVPHPFELYRKIVAIPEDIEPMPQVNIAKLVSQVSDEDIGAPEKILHELSQHSFYKFLENIHISFDTMENMFKLLDFACQCDDLKDVLPLFSRINANRYFILRHLSRFLSSCLEDIDSERISNSLTNVGTFLITLQKFQPASVSKTLNVIKDEFRAILKKAVYDSEVHNLYTAIQVQDEIFSKTLSSKSINRLAILEITHCLTLPTSYRCLATLPYLKDLLAQPFFRPNLTTGQYTDCDHYLDVNFRLFREDMLHYVRKGVEAFKQNQVHNEDSFLDNINIYEDVTVKNVMVISTEKVNFQLSLNFDPFYLEGINLEKTNRLAYGSLLCLSTDKFEKHLLYGFVTNRNIKDLRKGYIQIELIDFTKRDFKMILSTSFVMLETTVFVLAYTAPLEIIKKLNEDRMPFVDYIVYAQKSIKPPGYLNAHTHYDFRPLFQPLPRSFLGLNWSDDEIKLSLLLHKDMPSYSYTFSPELDKYKSIKLLDDQHWPSHQEVSLDSYQFEAFKAGLTKELALIQGPPGTGKTFIGLRIVQILLHNSQVWGPSPILILCFKNHALDQFLEGLLPLTTNIIRLGTQSKSEKLAPYMLSNIMNHATSEVTDLNDKRSQLEHKMEACEELKNLSDHQLVSFDILKEFITDKQIKSFQEDYENGILKSDDMLSQWLCLLEEENFDLAAESVNMAKDKIIYEKQDSIMKLRQKLPFNKDEEEVDIDYLHSSREYVPLSTNNFEENSFDNESNFDSDEDANNLNSEAIIKYHFNISEDMGFEEASTIDNVWLLDLKQRWRLYRFWILQMKTYKALELEELSKECESVVKEIFDFICLEKLNILGQAQIIGATTTGATLQNKLLQKVSPKIILIEEAAEILEPHTIAPLSANTQHLILIGDHQQLRPTTSVHELAVNYGLEVSLFERMVNNGLQSYRLVTQHRMRPGIAQLLYPHIYPTLSHHEKVLKYDPIKGISSNIYFLCHTHPDSKRKGTKSFYNEFEADFLINLSVYLIYQGYDGSQITILATYQGQVSHIKDKIEKYNICKHILVTTVDNYQGEENDIILISFVRSNDTNSIGFLKISNRVCVALSRARKGLYCVGNFDLMAKESSLWTNICGELNKQGAIDSRASSGLRLRCQNHDTVITKIREPKDFEKVRYGGCQKECMFNFDCGHQCHHSCHMYDKEHKFIRCQQPCRKILCKQKHRCKKLCSQPCGDCEELVWKKLPGCSHPAKMHCSQDPDTYICTLTCSKKLRGCGHPCKALCYQICMPCEMPCSIRSDCGHFFQVPCHLSENKLRILALCSKDCETELDCGHLCKGKCGECFQGRFHIPCTEICNKVLLCGHFCKQPCYENCAPCPEQCGHLCEHSRCLRKCGFPCAKCNEPCQWSCEHYACTNKCHEMCNRPPCVLPCPRTLPCGHDCVGFCGDPCIECPKCFPEIFDAAYSKSEKYVLLEDCGHIFSSEVLDNHFGSYFQTRELSIISCPKCKKAVFKNKRYGHIINEAFNSIRLIIKEAFGTKMEIKIKILNTIQKLEGLRNVESFILKWFSNYDTIVDNLNNHVNNCAAIQDLTLILNIISILEFLVVFVNFLDHISAEIYPQKLLALNYLTTFLGWLEATSLNLYHFHMEYIKKEAKRLLLLYQVLKWQASLNSLNFGVEKIVTSLVTKLFMPHSFTKSREKEAQDLFKKAFTCQTENAPEPSFKLLTLMPIMNVLKQGWGKCEKGHFVWMRSKSKKKILKCLVCIQKQL